MKEKMKPKCITGLNFRAKTINLREESLRINLPDLRFDMVP